MKNHKFPFKFLTRKPWMHVALSACASVGAIMFLQKAIINKHTSSVDFSFHSLVSSISLPMKGTSWTLAIVVFDMIYHLFLYRSMAEKSPFLAIVDAHRTTSLSGWLGP
jgi:hypothetical protein